MLRTALIHYLLFRWLLCQNLRSVAQGESEIWSIISKFTVSKLAWQPYLRDAKRYGACPFCSTDGSTVSALSLPFEVKGLHTGLNLALSEKAGNGILELTHVCMGGMLQAQHICLTMFQSAQ